MNNYFLALLLTLIIEIFVTYILGFKNKKILIAVFFANLITHPLLSYFLWINSFFYIIPINYISIITYLEILIVIVESILLQFATRKNYLSMLKLSLIINATSFFIGLLLF